MKSEIFELQFNDKSIQVYPISELIKIILNEEKSNQTKNLYSPTNFHEQKKKEQKEIRVAEGINQNGFEYFVDRLIEKECYLSASVRRELIAHLLSSDNTKLEMKKKVI